jgi:hypothetical protein
LFVVMTGMMQMVECVISDGVPEIMEELQWNAMQQRNCQPI